MTPIRLFISSVQHEFVEERAALRDYVRGDALMRRFFEVFVFEDVPAVDRRVDELYLGEGGRADIYIGLFGNEYGPEDAQGLSPTACEFEVASKAGKYRLIYLKETADEPALDAGLLEMTRPGTPQSRLQKYRLTEKGRETLAALDARRKPS